MGDVGKGGQFALQEQTEQLKEGETEKAELSSEAMENTKKLLDDPSLGLTDEQKEEYMADPQKLADALPGMKSKLSREIKKGDIGKIISNIDGAIGQRMEDGVTPDEDEYGGDPNTDKRQRVRDLLANSIKGKDNKKEFDFVTKHADGQELSALEEKGEMLARRKLMDQVSAGLKESGYNPPPIGANKGINDSPAGAGEPKVLGTSGSSGGQGAGNISAGSVTINAGSINLQGGASTIGNGSAGNASVNQSGTNGGASTNAGASTTSASSNASAGDGTSDDLYDIGRRDLTHREERKLKKEAKNDAGLGEAKARRKNAHYKAAHMLEDAMYITSAPGDWKGTADRREGLIKEKESKRKEVQEREKKAWAGDKQNISYMADVYMPKMEAIYAGQGKSKEYIRDKAEEKAKTELAKMSEFVPYGITDVATVSHLYEHQKQHGFTPDQAIRNMAGYRDFNSNKSNVVQVNKLEIDGAGSFKSVEQALPNAQYYFGNGYTNVDEIGAMEKLARQLQTSPEFTIKIHEALKKKGGNVQYSEGLSPQVKTKIDEINKNYRKLLKDKGIK